MSRYRPPDIPQTSPVSFPARPAVSAVKSPARFPVSPPASAMPLPSVATAVSPIQNVAVLFMLGVVFVRFSFLHEIIGLTIGARSFLPVLFGVPAVIGFFVCGGVANLWRNMSARFFFLYTIWLILACPFSVWPGGSLTLVISYIENHFILFLLIGGLVTNIRDLRRLLYVMAFAGLLNELTGRYLSTEDQNGRLNIGNEMSIGNSNDFAAQLLLILPLFWFTMTSKLPFVVRILFLPLIPYGLYLTLKTGSRGALVGLAVVYLMAVMQSKGVKRLITAVVIPLVCMAVMITIPKMVESRLATVFADNPGDLEALASAMGRKHLFLRSIDLTIEHPVLGVGPGEFADTVGGAAAARGAHGMWMQTHNSYTQVSSEDGIPAMLFLLISLGIGLHNARRVQKEARKQQNRALEKAAFAVLVAAVGFCACAFFLSLAYRFYFPAVVGLTTALTQVAKNESNGAAAGV